MDFVYHGTTKTNARKIQKNGFREYSYFATDLKDALACGSTVIWVLVDKSSIPNNWQFKIPARVEPGRIYKIETYTEPEVWWERDWMRECVLRSGILEYEYYNRYGVPLEEHSNYNDELLT